MTALTIVQEAAAWLALPVPTALFSPQDAQTIQLRSLLNKELLEIRKWPDSYWRKLIRQHTFVTVAADVQTLTPLPTDLDYIIPETMWDRTMTRPCVGPITPQDWQAWEARPILTSVIWGWRLRGNDFLTAPNPPAGDTVAYEYISNLAVYASGSLTPDKTTFTADTDTSIFNETQMSLGVQWRFLAAKGLPYKQPFDEWFALVTADASRNKGLPVLNTAGNLWNGLAGPYVPSFNFPGP